MITSFNSFGIRIPQCNQQSAKAQFVFVVGVFPFKRPSSNKACEIPDSLNDDKRVEGILLLLLLYALLINDM